VKIELCSDNEDLNKAIKNFSSYIESETLATLTKLDKFDLEKNIEFEDLKLTLKVRK
jgi:hypothetical protein